MAYYFTLTKYTDLSPEQQLAVDQTEPLALSGGPGTGKSVVCVWRHLRNYETGSKKSLLLTYTKTLEYYLKYSTGDKNIEARDSIDRIVLWSTGNSKTNELKMYDEIIIDEAQDIKSDKFRTILSYAESLSYSADKKQSLYQNDENLDELFTEFSTNPKTANNQKITLSKNYRNSQEILLFIRSAFPNVLISKNVLDDAKITDRKPVVHRNLTVSTRSNNEKLLAYTKDILKIVNHYHRGTHNIAILVPFVYQIELYYNALIGLLPENIEVSKYYNTLTNFEGMMGVHITTFKSSKGTEFDTVIIPEFDSTFFSGRVLEQEFYVAFTRAKLNLFLLCGGEFPDYFDINTVLIEE